MPVLRAARGVVVLMADIVTALMRRGLGGRGVLQPSGTRGFGLPVVIVALAACLAVCALATGDAWAGWSSTIAVDESKTCGPPTEFYGPDAGDGFDAHGGMWVACETHGVEGGLVIGRLTVHDKLADTHVVPGTEGQAVYRQSMSIDRSGVGVLAWAYNVLAPGAKAQAEGVEAITWRVGRAPGKAVVLVTEQVGLWRGPSAAIDESGHAVVLFGANRWRSPGGEYLPGQEVQAAHLEHDRLLGVAPLAMTGMTIKQAAGTGYTENVGAVEILRAGDEGFQASWQIVDEPFGSGGPYPPREVIVGARGESDGDFSEPVRSELTPLSPVANPPLGSFSYSGTVSDGRGDQAATWVSGPVSGIGDPSESDVANVYIATRRAGEPLAPAQLIGQAPYGIEEPRTAIGPTGRVTVLWHGTSHQLLVATGTAGGTFSAPRPVAPDTGLRSIALAVTPRNQVIALWERHKAEGGEGTIEATTSKDGTHFSAPRVISKRNLRITDCFSPALTVAKTGAAQGEWECLTNTPGDAVDEFARYEPY